MSIDARAQVAIILLACRPCVVIVNCLGQVLYLGRAPRTKETLPDFRECRVGYSISTSILRVDGLSTNTPVLGCHNIKQIIAEAYLNSPLVNLFLESCGFVLQIRMQLSNPL